MDWRKRLEVEYLRITAPPADRWIRVLILSERVLTRTEFYTKDTDAMRSETDGCPFRIGTGCPLSLRDGLLALRALRGTVV
jgi:hypothetical protein